MSLDEFCTDRLFGKENTFSCPLGLDSIEILADFTASLGNPQSIQGLGSQMPALISIDKGKGGMSKCKTFPSSIELREAAWCREEVESRTSGLYLLLALLPNLLCDFEQVLFYFIFLPFLLFCAAGRAHLHSHGALGMCRDCLRDHDQMPQLPTWRIHMRQAMLGWSCTPEGTRGVVMPFESTNRKMHCTS